MLRPATVSSNRLDDDRVAGLDAPDALSGSRLCVGAGRPITEKGKLLSSFQDALKVSANDLGNGSWTAEARRVGDRLATTIQPIVHTVVKHVWGVEWAQPLHKGGLKVRP